MDDLGWRNIAEEVLADLATDVSHPADFTPVCTTELGRVAALKGEFEKRNTKVVGLSVDPLGSHREWAGDIEDVTGHKLNFPLVADPDRKVADLYGMIHPNASDTTTVRSVFVIGPDKKVKLTLTYPAAARPRSRSRRKRLHAGSNYGAAARRGRLTLWRLAAFLEKRLV